MKAEAFQAFEGNPCVRPIFAMKSMDAIGRRDNNGPEMTAHNLAAEGEVENSMVVHTRNSANASRR
jgi:hypothetical protein